ncbi:hypothetical protein [Streptomyces vinaceus]|uniref:hypothetical protein n=1 Tax=Streptomyces vinaceus TaxID=1960 RepID=UPI0036C8D18D
MVEANAPGNGPRPGEPSAAPCPAPPDGGEGAVCTTASRCRRVGAARGGVESPVCVGRSLTNAQQGPYYWLCRQCMIVYPGFETEAEALRMARSHGLLRWREHAVGQAVRTKRLAGLDGDLTYEELRTALGGT